MTVCLITGCRHWHPDKLADRIVARLKIRYGDDLTIRHGAATGIDAAFDRAAKRAGVKVDPHPAKWDDLEVPGTVIRRRRDGTPYNANAGPVRNSAMVKLGADLCIACHRDLIHSRGTLDCARKCLAAGIPVYLIDADDAEPRRIEEI